MAQWLCMYLGTELGFDPVEVVVEVTSLHQFTTPGCQLGNDPRSLQNKGPDINKWKRWNIINCQTAFDTILSIDNSDCTSTKSSFWNHIMDDYFHTTLNNTNITIQFTLICMSTEPRVNWTQWGVLKGGGGRCPSIHKVTLQTSLLHDKIRNKETVKSHDPHPHANHPSSSTLHLLISPPNCNSVANQKPRAFCDLHSAWMQAQPCVLQAQLQLKENWPDTCIHRYTGILIKKNWSFH